MVHIRLGDHKMTWEEIKELLYRSTKTMTREHDIDHKFSGVSMLPTLRNTLDPDTVWFAKSTDWSKLPEQTRGGNAFILFSDVQTDFFPFPEENLAFYDDREEWQACFHALITEFAFVNRIKNGILDLLRMATSDEGLRDIANKIAVIYGLPTSIIDNSFSFVAVSDDFITLPYVYIRNEFEAGLLNLETQEIVRSNEFMFPQKIRYSTAFWDYHFPDEGPLRNYLTLIYIDTIQIGSFSLFTMSDKPLPKCRINLLPAIAQIISIAMQQSDFYLLNKATYFSNMLMQILDPLRQTDQLELRKSLHLFGYDLKRYKHLIYIDFSEEDFDIRQAQTFAEHFHPSIPNSIFMIHERNILYFKSSDENVVIPEAEISDWIQIVSQTNLKIGVSSMFEDVSQAQSYLKQARSVIETGRKLAPQTTVYNFDDYRLSDMVAHMSDDMDYYYYCYPPLQRLIERDAISDTNLAYTLYKYLENPANPAEVCKELFIHKNTLYYRMDKIREIMQADLKRADVIAQIQLTFQILKYKNRFASMIERKPD